MGKAKNAAAEFKRLFDREPTIDTWSEDGKKLTQLNVNSYRSFLSLVSQEPTLYQGTIKENILLGVDQDHTPEEAVIKACKDANIYDFIMSLP